jgi:hypothetical protein
MARENPRLLVVTPTLGTSPYLAAAVANVQRLGGDVHHVLVSPPGVSVALSAAFGHCTVVAEPSPSGGMYAAIDAAIRGTATCDWLTYLNDDDLFGPHFADVSQRHIVQGNSNAVAYGDVRWIDDAGRNLGLMPVERQMAHVGYVMKLGLAPFVQQGSIVSRAVYERLGGFGTRYHLAADFDFWVRAFNMGVEFRYYPQEVASWRIHSAQASMDREAAHAQGAAIASSVDLQASPFRLWYEHRRFHALNTRRYLQRYRETGLWSSDAVFAAAKNATR